MPIRIAPDGQNSGLWDALQRAQHDAGLLACRGGVRLEAAVRHTVDDAGAVQRLHGGQGVGRDAALVREGSDRLLVKLHAEVLRVVIEHDGHVLTRDRRIRIKRRGARAVDDAVRGRPVDVGRVFFSIHSCLQAMR